VAKVQRHKENNQKPRYNNPKNNQKPRYKNQGQKKRGENTECRTQNAGEITKNQDTRAQRITNTGCRKAGEYKGMRGGEHKQRSIPMGPDFVQISLDSTLNHPAPKLHRAGRCEARYVFRITASGNMNRRERGERRGVKENPKHEFLNPKQIPIKKI